MARILLAGKYEQTDVIIPPMPQIVAGLGVYSQYLGDRLTTFPQNQAEFLEMASNPLPEVFRHKLRYDAESVFWCLFWWCILAQPSGKNVSRSDIAHQDWYHLTTTKDQRDVIVLKFPTGCLHPDYKFLEPLLQDMAKLLRGDYDFSQDNARRNSDEYMSEAFQRLLLNFLYNHWEEPFMNMEKSPEKREVEKIIGVSPASGSPSKRTPLKGESSLAGNKTPRSSHSGSDQHQEDGGLVSDIL